MKLKYRLLHIFVIALTAFAAVSASALELKDIEIDQVELLTLSSSFRAPESIFGHSALLLIPRGEDWSDAFVVSFVANTSQHPEKDLQYLAKGATGGFPFTVSIESAPSYFYKNLINEKRDIERTILPMTQAQKAALWQTSLSFRKNPSQMGPYYFIQNNCATLILHLLKQAGFPINTEQVLNRKSTAGVSPKQVASILTDVLMTPLPSITIKSLHTRIWELEYKYKINLKSDFSEKTNTFSEWSPPQIVKMKSMSKVELILAMQSLSILDSRRNHFIREELKLRPEENDDLKFVDFVVLPNSFYNICQDSKCMSQLTQDLRAFYSDSNLRTLYGRNQSLLRRTENLFIPSVNFATSPQALHWKLLLNGMKSVVSK